MTIAVLDTGFWQDVSQNYGNRVLKTVDVTNGNAPIKHDPYGHGTHVTAIAASGSQALNGSYAGIAPSANLVLVRAFNGEAAGRYTDVISGVNWIVANRDKYQIRVLNLSFGALPQSYYWDDPLNQAVMAAWRAGIVVAVVTKCKASCWPSRFPSRISKHVSFLRRTQRPKSRSSCCPEPKKYL